MKTSLACLLVIGLTGCGVVRSSGGGDAADGGTSDATTCSEDIDCPLDQPICDQSAGTCRGCEASSDCTGKPGREFCDTSSGACVACLEDGDCPTAAAFLCDEVELQCRGCVDNSECGMGICDLDTSQCIGPDDIIWVDADSSAADSSCGSRASPCKSVAVGAGKVSELGVTGAMRHMVILPGQAYRGPATVSLPQDLYVSAFGAEFKYNAGIGILTSFEVSLGRVSWHGGVFDGDGIDLGIDTPRAFDVSSDGVLRIFNVAFKSLANGFTGGEAELEIYDCLFEGGRAGINTAQRKLRVERSRFVTVQKAILQSGPTILLSNLFQANDSSGQSSGLVELSTPAVDDIVQVAFNTFYGNSTHAASGTIQCGGAGEHFLISNIIWEVDSPPLPSCNGTILGNILDVVDLAPILNGGDNTNDDPIFVNPALGNFELSTGSPAVDTGDKVFAPAYDINQRARSRGLGPDIGAYESL